MLALIIGTLAAPIVASASAVTGATEVSTTVSGSMAGPAGGSADTGNRGTAAREEGPAGTSGAALASPGMALADLGGAPLMLVAPPQVFSLEPHGKLRASTLVGEDAVYGMTVGGGAGGGVSNAGFQSSGACASCLSGGSNQQTVPEPFTLLLAVPAVALAVRRRMQSRA